ncbi:MAG TPA: hypothetical protein VMI11_09670 [Actinomycetes bacterium]|nr:hypothetical protein [Actinomycetes bacterium]
MAFVQVSEAPSRAAYDSVLVALGGERPAGRLIHAAAQLPDGRIQIVDVWESRTAIEEFTPVIMKAFADAGVMEQAMVGGPPIPYETFELDHSNA